MPLYIFSSLNLSVMIYSEAVESLRVMHEEATKCSAFCNEGWYLLQYIKTHASLMKYLVDSMPAVVVSDAPNEEYSYQMAV